MNHLRAVTLAAILVALAGCANTIEGIGEDTASAVDATQQAAEDVAGALN